VPRWTLFGPGPKQPHQVMAVPNNEVTKTTRPRTTHIQGNVVLKATLTPAVEIYTRHRVCCRVQILRLVAELWLLRVRVWVLLLRLQFS
jgi:hypothetical protein